jgi:adenine phosphoribosyltransferase
MRERLQELAENMPRLAPEHVHDLWGLYRDGDRVRYIIEMLVDPFTDAGLTAIVGGEARGFLLGGMASYALNLPFIPVRKAGGYLPGPKMSEVSRPDWEGKTNYFEIQAGALSERDRVLVLDDWYTTGSQGCAIRSLVERSGAIFAGVAVVVEEGNECIPDMLGDFHALLRWDASIESFEISPFNLSLQPGRGLRLSTN